MKEMSQTQSYSYYVHEFNHGPKTMADERSLIMLLTPVMGFYRMEKVLGDILALDSNVFIVSGSNIKGERDAFVLMPDPGFKSELVLSFINIPVFQLLAYINAARKSMDPDRPRNLNFTTRL